MWRGTIGVYIVHQHKIMIVGHIKLYSPKETSLIEFQGKKNKKNYGYL